MKKHTIFYFFNEKTTNNEKSRIFLFFLPNIFPVAKNLPKICQIIVKHINFENFAPETIVKHVFFGDLELAAIVECKTNEIECKTIIEHKQFDDDEV